MFFLFQKNFKSWFVSTLTWIMEAGNFHTLGKQELLNIIGQKSATIQTLINERKWIEEDNHLQRIQAIELKEKLLKWQTYASQKEKQLSEMQNETARLKEDGKKWRAGFFRAVETLRTWKTKYTAMVKKHNATKQQLDHLITLGKYMREERDLYKYNCMALLQYIFYQPPSNAVAEIIEIEKELLSNALVPLFQNQSSTAPPDVRTLISSSGGISVKVNYPGGLHCPTQTFARSNFIEIPHIRPLVLPAVRMAALSGTKTKLRKGEEVFASRSRAADHAKALVAGASPLLARPEEGRIVTSSISERDDLSAGHVSTWQSLTTVDHDKAKVLVTGASPLLARPEEGRIVTSSISERDDLSAGHVSTWQSLTTVDHDKAKVLVTGASPLLARPEEGRIVTSSISERDDLSAGHVSTWQSLTTVDHDKAKVLVTGTNLILARPEEGRASIGSNSLHTIVDAPSVDAGNSSDIDLFNGGYASNESKVKVRKDIKKTIFVFTHVAS